MSLTIELDHDESKLWVTLPDGTHIKLPTTQWGMDRLRELLLAQNAKDSAHYGKVASRQVPTQWALDMFARKQMENPITKDNPQVTRLAPRSRKITNDLTYEDLGITAEDIKRYAGS